jgi:hypothetical protein
MASSRNRIASLQNAMPHSRRRIGYSAMCVRSSRRSIVRIEPRGTLINVSLVSCRAVASSRRVVASSHFANASSHHANASSHRDVACLARDPPGSLCCRAVHRASRRAAETSLSRCVIRSKSPPIEKCSYQHSGGGSHDARMTLSRYLCPNHTAANVSILRSVATYLVQPTQRGTRAPRCLAFLRRLGAGHACHTACDPLEILGDVWCDLRCVSRGNSVEPTAEGVYGNACAAQCAHAHGIAVNNHTWGTTARLGSRGVSHAKHQVRRQADAMRRYSPVAEYGQGVSLGIASGLTQCSSRARQLVCPV